MGSNHSFCLISKGVLKFLKEGLCISSICQKMMKGVIPPTIGVINGAWWMWKDIVPTVPVTNVARKVGELLFPAFSIIDVTWKSGKFVFPAFLISYLAGYRVFQLLFPAFNITETAFVAQIRKSTHSKDNSKGFSNKLFIIRKGYFLFKSIQGLKRPTNYYRKLI